MKIAILGPVFINVKFELDGEFNPLGPNEGKATMTYSGPYVELAKKLSEDNDVTFISSLDTQASVFIKKYLSTYNIDVRNIAYEPNGTAFNIHFNNGSEFRSGYSLNNAVNRFQLRKDHLIEDLGVEIVIISDLFPEVIDICKSNNIRVVWFAEQSDIDRADYESDADLLSKVEIVSTDDVEEVLG